MPNITALPTPPSRSDPTNFNARADTYLAHLQTTFTPEVNALRTEVLAAQTAANTSASNAATSASTASTKATEAAASATAAATSATTASTKATEAATSATAAANASRLTVGAVATGPAAVSITGPAGAQVLNITVPQGPQGPQGPSGGVNSFNTRTGAVTLSSADVTGALGFTPIDTTGNAATATRANGSLQSVKLYQAGGSGGYGQLTHTWIKPANLARVRVTVAAGGGGGLDGGFGIPDAVGGQGGSVVGFIEAANLPSSIAVTVGGLTAWAVNGYTSSFGTLITAYGGAAGSTTDHGVGGSTAFNSTLVYGVVSKNGSQFGGGITGSLGGAGGRGGESGKAGFVLVEEFF